MAVTKEDVVEFISNMSVLELSEFIKELEEKFGVSAAAPVAVAAAGAAPSDAGAAQEDRITSYNVCYTKLLRTAIFLSSWRLYFQYKFN